MFADICFVIYSHFLNFSQRSKRPALDLHTTTPLRFTFLLRYKRPLFHSFPRIFSRSATSRYPQSSSEILPRFSWGSWNPKLLRISSLARKTELEPHRKAFKMIRTISQLCEKSPGILNPERKTQNGQHNSLARNMKSLESFKLLKFYTFLNLYKSMSEKKEKEIVIITLQHNNKVIIIIVLKQRQIQW